MRRRAPLWIVGVLTAAAVAALLLWPGRTLSPEVPIVAIPLAGGPEQPQAEISGLAWSGDTLVLLPQYPDRFGGALFAVERSAIEAALDGRSPGPVSVRSVSLAAPGLEEALPGFDGFEAIAFAGRDVYLTVETRSDTDRTVGYLMRGRAHGSPLSRIDVDVAQRVRLAAQTDLANTGYEALVVDGSRVLTIYEANGDINPRPRVLAFDRALRPLGELPLSTVEYRVTDASAVDAQRRFWVSNYHWPGSPWQPGVCRLTEQYGDGESHARCDTVERLVELQITDGGVETTARPPILFELVDDEHARNWEGLVRLPGRGFLVMTDEHPQSILAFVPGP